MSREPSVLDKGYPCSLSRIGVYRYRIRAVEEFGAGNETRTRDPNLGKVVLYQLSYSRIDLI